MIAHVGARNFNEAVKMGSEIYDELKFIFLARIGKTAVNVVVLQSPQWQSYSRVCFCQMNERLIDTWNKLTFSLPDSYILLLLVTVDQNAATLWR
jgi:hypothetical protein